MSLTEMLTYTFTRHAFLMAVMASVPLGIVGTLIVVRRIGYLASAIAHCALGGVGVGLFLQATLLGAGATGFVASVVSEPTFVALVTAVVAAVLIGILRHQGGEREDAAIGIVWAGTMAAGLLCLDLTAGNTDITGYLFGDILLISVTDLGTVAVLSVAVFLTQVILGRRLAAACFDPEFAELRGAMPSIYLHIVLILAAVTIVLLMRIVGMLLMVALLTLPAATAARFTQRLGPMMITATGICLVCLVGGLYISCAGNFSSGPSIIAVAATLYGLTLIVIPRRMVV